MRYADVESSENIGRSLCVQHGSPKTDVNYFLFLTHTVIPDKRSQPTDQPTTELLKHRGQEATER
jgi:hypothetical protein